MTNIRNTLLVILALAMSCDSAGWGIRRSSPTQRKKPVAFTPTCNYDSSENEIFCDYLQADSMDLLRQSLALTAEFESSFAVFIEESSGPDIPLDVFKGYNVTSLEMMYNNFSSIPYELLSNIPTLTSLYIMSEDFSSAATTATDLFLPFGENLLELQLAVSEIPQYDPGTFSQYTNLKSLFLNTNPVKSIGLELLNLFSLQSIDYWYNSISVIETGAFRDLRSLEALYLNYNNLSTLQEGAFQGLENSPMKDIGLSYNPWNCDCDLQWLKDWLNARNLSDSSGAMCAPPKNGTFNQVTFC